MIKDAKGMVPWGGGGCSSGWTTERSSWRSRKKTCSLYCIACVFVVLLAWMAARVLESC